MLSLKMMNNGGITMYTDNIEHVRESEERIIETIEIVEDYYED